LKRVARHDLVVAGRAADRLAWLVPRTAPTGSLSVTANDSSFSSDTRSPLTGTVMTLKVWPGANTSSPLVAV
jgi:hypothetical protein